MRILIAIITILWTCSPVLSQVKIQGKVVELKSGNPISYVNIVKHNIQQGTYSNENGEFEISISKNDTIIFSAIGYKQLKLSSQDLSEMRFLVQLEEESILLEDVIVKAEKVREKSTIRELGYAKSKKKSRLVSKTPGFQISVFIENTEKTEGILETVLLNMVSSGKTRIRLRIYSRDQRFMPLNDLLKENIIIDINKGSGIRKVNLGDKGIIFPKEGVIISIEFIGELDKQNKLIQLNGEPMSAKLFLSKEDESRNTMISFMGRNFEREMYSVINGTNCNGMIGLLVRYYEK